MPSTLDQQLARFRADPTDRRAFEALEEGYFLASKWDGLRGLYEQRLAANDLGPKARERARILFRLGQIHSERFSDDDAAADCHRQALAIDPSFRPPLVELRRIHIDRGQWVVALQITEAEAALEMSDPDRAELLTQLGSIWLDHLLEPESSLEQFEQALEHEPKNPSALAGAARASHELGQAGEAARYWERCAAACRGPERARALVAQAGLLIGVLGSQERAAPLYQSACEADPENRDAVDALAALAESGRRWPELALHQQRRFELCPDPEQRGAIALATGRLYLDQLEDSDSARRWLTLAAELGAADTSLYRALADMERERGDDTALRHALENLVALTPERSSVSTLMELATLYSDTGDEDRALELLNRALTQAPDDALVIEALCDTLARLARHEELADVLERRAALAATDRAQCATILADLGALQEIQLEDIEAARQAYEQAMMADPTTRGVAEALERIYRKTEAWNALRGLLDQVSRSGDHQSRTRQLCALGELLVERFSDPEAASAAFDRALSLDLACAAAHRGRQRLAVESGDEDRILETFEAEATISSDASRFASLIQEIARIHERRGDSAEALEWTQRWAAAAPENSGPLRLAARFQEQIGLDDELLDTLERLDPMLQSHAQAENRRRVAAVHIRHGRSDQAVVAHRRALDVDPADVESLRALDALLQLTGRPEELAGVRRQLAELVPETERAEHLEQLARLLEERLGDLPGAIDALTELSGCEAAPADVQDRIDELLERSARHEELAARLDERVSALEAKGESCHDLLIRRGLVLLEHLSRFDQASQAYRRALVERPNSAEARAGLERSLRAAGDSAGLADYLAERIAEEPAPEDLDRFVLERAVIQEEVLDDVASAVESYRELSVSAQRIEDRVRASGRLEVLLERGEEWEELRAHLERVLSTLENEARVPVLERLAQLCRDRLADPEAALAHLEASALLCPERPEPWRALAQLYEAAERPEDLARALEADLDTNVDRERELDLRRRVAALCAHELDDADRAASHFERILALEPGDSSAAEFLVRLFEIQERPREVVRILEHRLDALDALPRDEAGDWAAQRTSLRRRIAGLRAGLLDDPDGAIAALEPALAEIGAQPVVAEPLADLYQGAGYLDELISLCRRAAAESAEGGRSRWYARLGAALRETGADAEAADAWRQVLIERPDDDTARAALRELYRRLEEPEPLGRLLEAELSSLAGPPEVPVRMELSRLYAGPLRNPADALGHLRRVVHVDPAHAAALTRGLELAEELQRGEVIIELLEVALDRPQAPAQRAALLTRRGRALTEQPDRVPEAVEAYREALRLDPSRDDVRADLRRLLEATGRHQEVLDCILLEAARGEPEERAALFEHAAELAWQQISPSGALPWLERLQQLQPDDPSVVARIAEAHRSAGRPAERVRALERQTTLAPDAVSKRDLALARARIFEEEIGAAGRAIAALEQARSFCPADPEALSELERLYRQLGRHRERAEVLGALLETAPGPDRVSLLCEAANLHAGPLAEPARAAELLNRAVDETPRTSALYVELLRTLGETLRKGDDELAWTRCAEAELAALDPEVPVFDDRRLELHRELALAYQQAGHLDASLRHFRCVVDSTVEGTDASGELGAALLRGLRAQGNSVELERRLGSWLEARDGSTAEWLELARLREEKLCDPSAAAEAYRRALDVDASCLAAIRGLRVTSERLGNWEEMAAMLEREVECEREALDCELRGGLLRRLAEVSWKKLESTTRASRTYAAALEANPEDFAAHRSFEQLLESMEDWRGALDLYESEVAVLGERDPDRRRAVWLSAGAIARDHTGEPERALRAYVNAAEIAPLDLAQARERAELHLRCDDPDAFVEVFSAWCDDPAAGAGADDQLRLADALEQLDRNEEAQTRVDRALELEPGCVEAWDVAARLREHAGDASGAAEALERATELTADELVAERLLRAAELRGQHGDLEARLELLRRSVRCDPGRAPSQAELALAALEQDSKQEAEEAAGHALALDGACGSLESERRLAVALAGGRAACDRDRLEAAAHFFEQALEVDPQHPDALAGAGETLARLGDLPQARGMLEARLALDAPNPDLGLHHALLARCAADEDTDLALRHCSAALEEDACQLEAHELRADLLEAAARVEDGVEALEAWSTAVEPGQRGWILERAARWELSEGNRAEAAEKHLRAAVEDDASLASAQILLSELLRDQERHEEIVEVTAAALNEAEVPEQRRALGLLRADALERGGDRSAAAEAYALASEADPGSLEAAMSQARLLRAAGDWRGAADALERLVNTNPGGDAEAEACMQLGRLRAGPLEDVEGAIGVYRRAVELRPRDLDLRTTLAELLSHRPDDREESLAHYREALESNPIHLPSLRAGLRAARESGNSNALTNGIALLRALGVAAPEEEAAAGRLTLKLAASGLDDPLSETLRQAVQKVSREIGTALAAPQAPTPLQGDGALQSFRAAALEAEVALTAPGLLPLPTEELGELLTCIAALALEADEAPGSGARLNAVSAELGRRARRRLRRILEERSFEEIRELDFAAWRRDVRALAAARAVDATGCDLRTALLALIAESSDRSAEEIQETADLTPLIADCPEAESLTRRAVRAWLEEV